MAGLNLNSLTENASRLGARIQESISEHTQNLNITRSPGSSYFDAPEERLRNVRKHLDSNSDREKLDALKTLIALISKGRNVSEFFPYVVKNVASQNLEIRKLVYIYLLRYAEAEPDLALLSINTFQKDLADPNPLIRAMALRVLGGINVPMIANIVVLAIKKCASDASPYVRKAAAYALIKCYNMDSSQLPSLIPIIETLLKDKSAPHMAALSVGAVAVSFQAICPTRLDLLHKHYRRLCRTLVDADAWGQVSLLDLLARYARTMLSKPIVSKKGIEEVEELDPDLELLLGCAEPLFMSRNAAVVLAVVRVFYYVGPPTQINKIVNPLLRLMQTSKEIERVVLSYIAAISHQYPALFYPHYARFLIRTSDILQIKRDKLRILLCLITIENYQSLLREFVVYADDANEKLVSDAIHGIGHCARLIPDSVPHCLSALMDFIKNGSDAAISNSVLVLKSLVQSQLLLPQNGLADSGASVPKSPLRIVAELAGRIDEVKHPLARACVVWLAGQYAASVDGQPGDPGISGIAVWAPDVLRRVAKTFASEAAVVKLQLVTLATKLLILSPETNVLILLSRYVFSLARYDANFDVRDRARMLSALLAGVSPDLRLLRTSWDDAEEETDTVDRGGVVLRREQVRLVLFEGKRVVQVKDVHSDGSEIIGSLHTVVDKPMGLYSSRRLPDWPDEGTDSSLRDADEEYPATPFSGQAAPRAIGSGMGSSNFSPSNVLSPASGPSPAGSFTRQTGPKGQWMDLDQFLASDGEEAEEESGEDEEDEEESGSDDHPDTGTARAPEGEPDEEEETSEDSEH